MDLPRGQFHIHALTNPKKPASKIKFMGRMFTKKTLLTWKQRADIVYLVLHPAFANGDAKQMLDRGRKGKLLRL